MNPCDGCFKNRILSITNTRMKCDIDRSPFLYPENFQNFCTCVNCIIKVNCNVWCQKRLNLYTNFRKRLNDKM
jgi:hypothetical protein